eukprot:TRINITY_DN427_c0_g2_i1.p1 TRINITY_DN427_c0_g2~~TRINITY_DN427_c0_g2_i1.p1  ORF type:complete len:1279 (+),score=502.02 TRINITY_DN427_c0_g2_i1:12957-16793(+)
MPMASAQASGPRGQLTPFFIAMSASAMLQTPWLTASAASLASMQTVRMTARPGTSARRVTAKPQAWSTAVIDERAVGLHWSAAATARRVALPQSSARSTTTVSGQLKSQARWVALRPSVTKRRPEPAFINMPLAWAGCNSTWPLKRSRSTWTSGWLPQSCTAGVGSGHWSSVAGAGADCAPPSPQVQKPRPLLRPRQPALTSSCWISEGVKRGSLKLARNTDCVTAKLTSWPIRSISSNGPMRKPPQSRSRASMVCACAACSCSSRKPSAQQGRATRLTMKPGVDLANTGDLPHSRAVSYTHCATSGSLARPWMTSTRAIIGTGLKKCMPTSRCGRRSRAEMLVMESEEVLLARMQSSATISSSRPNSSCFTSSCSAMASTTRPAPARSSSTLAARRRMPAAWADSPVIFSRMTSLSYMARICTMAFSTAPGRVSNRQTMWPAAAATWAMPAPMVPLPMTATVTDVARACVAECLLMSLSRELWCALFQESGHAFAVVTAVAQCAHAVAFQVQLLFQRIGRALVERGLGGGQALGGCPGEVLRHGAGLLHQLVVVDAFPDQAPLLGLLGADLVAQQCHAHGARRAHQARQEIGAAGIGDQPQLAEHFDEIGRACRQHDVAGQRDIGAGTGSHAIDGADHREGQGAQRFHQWAIVFLDGFAQVDGGVARLDGAVAQVLAGAEAAAGTGQQQHAHRGIGLQAGDGVAQLQVHGDREAVELVRAIEGDDGDAVAVLDEDGCVVHGSGGSHGVSLGGVGDRFAGLHHAEAIGDEGRIGQRAIGGRVGTGAVEVTEGGRLVHEDPTGEVERQRHAGIGGSVLHHLLDGGIDAVARQGQRTLHAGGTLGQGNRGGDVVDRDDEADRAEVFLGDGLVASGLHHQRRADARMRELRMDQCRALQQDLAGLAGRIDALQHALVLDRSQEFDCLGRIHCQPGQGTHDGLRHVLETDPALGGGDAFFGDVDVLWRGTHLARVQRQREGDVVYHPGQVVGAVDDDLVDAGLLGIDLRLAGMAFQPVAVGAAAGEVDQADLRAQRQGARHLGIAGIMRGQRDDVRVEAGLGDDLARHLHRDGQRQDGTRMRLDDDRIAGGQVGEQAGVAVPGREGAAADHQADTARHDAPGLLHHQRRMLALRFFPPGTGGDGAQLLPGAGDGFQRAVLRMRAAGLEGHHEGLAGSVLDRMGDLDTACVEARDDLQRHTGPDLRAGTAPAGCCQLHRRQQAIQIGARIADAQGKAIGRDLCPGPLVATGLLRREHEGVFQPCLVGQAASLGSAFAIDARTG